MLVKKMTSLKHTSRREIHSRIGKREPLIALLTDFGNDEASYLVRSAIRHVHPKARIEDITHHLPPFNVLRGAWRLARVVSTATEAGNTIYVAVVDPGVGTDRKRLIVRTKTGKYLVGPDNGLLSLAFQNEGIDLVVSIDNKDLTLLHLARSSTFDGKDVFGPVAAHLAKGVDIRDFGELLDVSRIQSISLEARKYSGIISGYLVDIDSFGNIRTTIPNSSFTAEAKLKDTSVYFNIYIRPDDDLVEDVLAERQQTPPNGELTTEDLRDLCSGLYLLKDPFRTQIRSDFLSIITDNRSSRFEFPKLTLNLSSTGFLDIVAYGGSACSIVNGLLKPTLGPNLNSSEGIGLYEGRPNLEIHIFTNLEVQKLQAETAQLNQAN